MHLQGGAGPGEGPAGRRDIPLQRQAVVVQRSNPQVFHDPRILLGTGDLPPGGVASRCHTSPALLTTRVPPTPFPWPPLPGPLPPTPAPDLSDKQRSGISAALDDVSADREGSGLRCVGGYVILEMLGKGAFGAVYKARK